MSLVLIMAIICSGCQSKKKNENADKDNFHKAAKVDEGALALDSVVLSVGSVKVTYKEALIYMYQLKEEYEPSVGSDIWNFKLENGKTFEEYAKEEVIKEITQLKIIKQKAAEMGVVLENDEKDELNQMAAKYVKGIPEKEKEQYGITQELMEQIYYDNQIASKMFDITTNVVNTNISDEQAKQITIQYLMVMTNGEDKNGKQIDMSGDEIANAHKRAVKLLKEAKKADSFYKFAEANTDDYDVELTFGKSDMPTEFGKEAFQLKKGEYSKLIQTESGFYILYCVNDFNEDATKMKKEDMIEQNQNKTFENTYAKWAKQYGVNVSAGLWNQIHFAK
jgi:PPIC-type PPIASE domain.